MGLLQIRKGNDLNRRGLQGETTDKEKILDERNKEVSREP